MPVIHIKLLVLATCLAVCYSNPLSINEHLDNKQNADKAIPAGIIGGKQSNIFRHPYQVAIFIDGSIAGSGIIIDKTHIATTASLIYHEHVDKIHVLAGNTNLSKGKIHAVKKVKLHPKFKKSNLDHDIAVLQLKTKLHLSKSIKKVSFGKKTLAKNTVVTLSGWGDISNDNSDTRHFKEAKLKIISKGDCKKANKGYPVPESTICALNKKAGPCWSDFGNVLVSNGKAYGLFSWAKSCDVKLPSVYTDLVKVHSWIEHTVKSNNEAEDNKEEEHVIAKRSPISFLDDNVVNKDYENEDVNAMVEIAMTKNKVEENGVEETETDSNEKDEAINLEQDEEANAEKEEKEQEEDEDEKESEAIEIMSKNIDKLYNSNEDEYNQNSKYHSSRKREVNEINKSELTNEESDTDDDLDLKVDKDVEEEKESEEREHDKEDPNINFIENNHEIVDEDEDSTPSTTTILPSTWSTTIDDEEEEVVDFLINESNIDNESTI